MSDISIRFRIRKDDLDDLYEIDYARTLKRYRQRFFGHIFLLLFCLSIFLAADSQFAIHKLGWWIPILIFLSIFAASRIFRAAGLLGKLKNLNAFLSAYRFKSWHGNHAIKLDKKQFDYRRDGKRKAIYDWTDFKEIREYDTYLRFEWGEQAPPPINDWDRKSAIIVSLELLKPNEVELIKEKTAIFRPKYSWDEKIAYYKVL